MGIILRTLLISFFLCNVGCSSVALLDASANSNESECYKQLHSETKSEAEMLESQFFGSSEEQMISKLGKPKKINSEKSPYLVNRKCFGKDCEIKLADEAWFYEFKKKIPSCGWYTYSIIIYFVDNKVIAVR